MEQVYRFGPVAVLFRDWPDFPDWPFWRWKLDPFRSEADHAQIMVTYTAAPVQPEGAPVWADADSGRQFYVLADGTVLWQQTDSAGQLLLQFTVSPDWDTITLRADNTPTAGVSAFESLTFLIYYAFLRQGILTLHGTIIEEGSRGFLLCADSGEGKTTHARLWRDEKNALILNGDRATCYSRQGQWFCFGTPWCGTSGEYLNRSAALQAVVILTRGKENRVTRADSMALLAHVVCPGWDRNATTLMLALLDQLLEGVPLLQLECTPEAEAVDVLYHALEKLAL